MSKHKLKETLHYPNKHKQTDNIESVDILIYESDSDYYVIAYYDWYGDINFEEVISFVENHFLNKLKILNVSDGNGRVNISFSLV